MSDRLHTLDGYFHEYQKSVAQPEEFWARIADSFHWKKRWSKVLEWNFETPEVQWFVNGKLNLTENIFEKNLSTLGDRPAIIWEPNEPGEEGRTLTYRQLFVEVCRFANTLLAKGIGKGDRVIIYMPMVPEAAIAMLACARIGAIHSVVFAGFSSTSLADRILDCKAKAVLTADGNYRGNKKISIKEIVDEALEKAPIETVIVYQRTGQETQMLAGRDYWWHEALEGQSEVNQATEMDSEDMLFILYTSGSTGKPKGVVHTTGGYMVYTKYSFENVFQYCPGDVFWCTADIGWITGHSYIVYAPLSAGGTSLMFEGIPTFPDAGRFWEIIDKFKVNILYTAPTAIRSLMGFGLGPVQGHDLSSLKVLGTVGEPINEEAWHWYDEHIGKKKCPIVDTWWQTETGGIMISNMAGITPGKPGWATYPMPGVKTILVDDKGAEVTTLEDGLYRGNLCITQPWPATLRTTYGDHERCRTNYFATYENLYFTGDGALQNEQGQIRITGRVDDVLNVSGHRIGTAEVENAINMHAGVVESAVVGYPHDIKGQGIYAYVIYTGSHGQDTHGTADMVRKDILQTVTRIIGPIAKPDKIQFVSGLPKTRSGKIMRRILRKVAEGELKSLGDTSTLLDPAVVDEIVKGVL